MPASPKPAKGDAKRAKARARRQEAAHAKKVRAACVARDGHCLIASRLPSSVAVLLGACEGPSEWMHVGEHRRFKTRGQAPEERHTTAGSGMGCEKHHDDYDAHLFDFALGAEGMDGTIGVMRRAA